MKFLERKAVGYTESSAIINGEICVVNIPEWTPTRRGMAIRSKRKSLDLGLRESARMMGLTGSELSAVENGRTEWVDQDEFESAMNRLESES